MSILRGQMWHECAHARTLSRTMHTCCSTFYTVQGNVWTNFFRLLWDLVDLEWRERERGLTLRSYVRWLETIHIAFKFNKCVLFFAFCRLFLHLTFVVYISSSHIQWEKRDLLLKSTGNFGHDKDHEFFLDPIKIYWTSVDLSCLRYEYDIHVWLYDIDSNLSQSTCTKQSAQKTKQNNQTQDKWAAKCE